MDINSSTDFGTIRILPLKGEKGDKGEDGTSGNYSQLTNKPSINNLTLDGNVTTEDLGLAPQSEVDYLADNTYSKTEIDQLEENNIKFADVQNMTIDSSGTIVGDGTTWTSSAPFDGWAILSTTGNAITSGADICTIYLNNISLFIDTRYDPVKNKFFPTIPVKKDDVIKIVANGGSSTFATIRYIPFL